MLDSKNHMSFTKFIQIKEGKEHFEQPHVINADPPMKIPAGIQRLAEAFKKSKEVSIGKEIDPKAGGEKDVTLKAKKLYIVGGAVRDYLLGHTPHNYNLATDAHPDEVERIIINARPAIQIVRKDKKNGTMKINVDGETYEIETMRKPDGVEDQGVTYTTNPAEDSERRDFTVNALYYDVIGNKIIDHTGGIRHLKDGVVKFIGNAKERLGQDGMKKFRYARMLNKVPNAKVDDEAKTAIANADTDDSPEAIRAEFWRGMEDLHSAADKYLKTYHDLGLLEKVFPKLELTMDFPNCKTCKSRPMVLASLLKNNRPHKLVEKLRELKYSDREIKDAVFLINLLVFSPEYIYDYKRELTNSSLTKRQILDWAKINQLDMDLIEKLLDYKFQVNPQEVIDNEGLHGGGLRERVRHLEAQAFMKKMKA